MRKLVFQYFRGPFNDFVRLSTFSIRAYAERIGAEYLFSDEAVPHSHYYGTLWPFFSGIYKDYDALCVVDCDVLATRNAEDVFTYDDRSRIGLVHMNEGPVDTASRQALSRWMQSAGATDWTECGHGNAGIVLFPDAQMESFSDFIHADLEKLHTFLSTRNDQHNGELPFSGYDSGLINLYCLEHGSNHLPCRFNYHLSRFDPTQRFTASLIHYHGPSRPFLVSDFGRDAVCDNGFPKLPLARMKIRNHIRHRTRGIKNQKYRELKKRWATDFSHSDMSNKSNLFAGIARVERPFVRVLEIGVAQGETAEKILQQSIRNHYLGIDPWVRYDQPLHAEFSTGMVNEAKKLKNWSTQAHWDDIHARVMQRLRPYRGRHRIIRGFSHEILPVLQERNERFEIIHIDGNHAYEYVLQDLHLSLPLLHDDGMIIVDDLELPQIKKAVREFLAQNSDVKLKARNVIHRQRRTTFHDVAETMHRAVRRARKPLSTVATTGDISNTSGNPLEQFRNRHHKQRVFLVGNGPSLKRMNLDLIKDEVTIAMNCISLIYPFTQWRPTYYLFASSNCHDPRWGEQWSQRIVAACRESRTTPFIWRRYREEIESRAGALDASVIYLSCMTENEIGDPRQFSTDAVRRLDKSGTSMNIALQLAYFMGFAETYLIGCDSNWIATDSDSGDPNHFDPSYKASIADGEVEFLRMETTHRIARSYFDDAGKKIANAGLDSAITAYEKVEFERLFENRQMP